MTTVENVTPKKTRARATIKKAPKQHIKQIENIVQLAKEQTLEIVTETQQALENEVNALNIEAQSGLQNFKQDLLGRLSIVQDQIKHSQQDLRSLQSLFKTELRLLMDDFNQFGKALKLDISEISLKRKDQLSETLKRTKDHTLQVWSKLYIKQ